MKCPQCKYTAAPAKVAVHVAKVHTHTRNMTHEGNSEIVPNPSGDGFVEVYRGKE